MLRLNVTQGAAFSKVLDTIDSDGGTPSTFLATDTLRCDFWDGQDRAVLFNPTVSWNDAATGKVNYSFTNTQCDLTAPNGTYRVQVFAARAGVEFCIADFQQGVSPSVGIATQAILTYCTYQDMLILAGWVKAVQDFDVDTHGFYSQRLLARNWMDSAIVNNYRGGGAGLYGAHSESAFSALGRGGNQSLGPSQIIIDYLAADKLLIKPQIVKVCAHRAVCEVAMAQLGRNNAFFQYGVYHRAMAERDMCAITAEIDTNADGIGEMFVNLGSSNPLFT